MLVPRIHSETDAREWLYEVARAARAASYSPSEVNLVAREILDRTADMLCAAAAARYSPDHPPQPPKEGSTP